MITPDLLIFNLDGIIVDVSGSVPSAIRRTVQNYFSHFLGIHGSGSLVDEETVQLFLQAGLDDPQELSAALIAYLLSLLPESFHGSRPPRSINEAASFLKKTSHSVRHISGEYLQNKADFPAMATRIRAAGGGTRGVKKVMKANWSHPLLMNKGQIGQSNLVGRLFLEIYFGQKNFNRITRLRPRFYRRAGLFDTETLRLKQDMLQALRRKYRAQLAVVTTRTLPNAQLIMEKLQINQLFDKIIMHEDTKAEAAYRRRIGKNPNVALPDPFMLIEAAERLDYGGTQPALYVGHTVNDMLAARAADESSQRPFFGWALLPSGKQQPALKQELMSAGAQQLFDEPAALVAQLLA